jgi:uncharacterized protein DUF3310
MKMPREINANDYQVSGNHYRDGGIQHWDFAASQNFDYFQGQITKYVTRWRKKNGVADLEKAMHFLQKYIEIAKNEKKTFNDIAHKEMVKAAVDSRNSIVEKFMKLELPEFKPTGMHRPFGYVHGDE